MFYEEITLYASTVILLLNSTTSASSTYTTPPQPPPLPPPLPLPLPPPPHLPEAPAAPQSLPQSAAHAPFTSFVPPSAIPNPESAIPTSAVSDKSLANSYHAAQLY